MREIIVQKLYCTTVFSGLKVDRSMFCLASRMKCASLIILFDNALKNHQCCIVNQKEKSNVFLACQWGVSPFNLHVGYACTI